MPTGYTGGRAELVCGAGTLYFAGSMKAATINEIKRNSNHSIRKHCRNCACAWRSIKRKQKELLTYLLYGADNEQSYIATIKEDMDSLFEELPANKNLYYVKKKPAQRFCALSIKQIKYSVLNRPSWSYASTSVQKFAKPTFPHGPVQSCITCISSSWKKDLHNCG